MTESKRNSMPTKKQICEYWEEDPHLLALEDVCWRCGVISRHLERAHILPKIEGGTNDESNMHLLCKMCHKETEHLWGKSYWQALNIEPHDLVGRAFKLLRTVAPAASAHLWSTESKNVLDKEKARKLEQRIIDAMAELEAFENG
jgi:hypothetical protein